jgi:hypothetical protein
MPLRPYKIGAFSLGEVVELGAEPEVHHILPIHAREVTKVETAAILCLVSQLTPVLEGTAVIVGGVVMGGIAALPHLVMQTIPVYPDIVSRSKRSVDLL